MQNSTAISKKISSVSKTFLNYNPPKFGTRNAVYQPPPGQDGTYKYKGPKSHVYPGEMGDLFPPRVEERNPAITPRFQIIGFLKGLGFIGALLLMGQLSYDLFLSKDFEKLKRKRERELKAIKESSSDH